MEKLSKLKAFSQRVKAKAQTLWELVMFFLMSGITTIVDLGVFALCNFLIFVNLRATPFSWWLLEYGPDNGGMCAFLSVAVSFAISQTVNFFLQRKATFSATNNVALSAIMYAVMVVAVYFLCLWLPSVIGAPIYALLGAGLGALAVKLLLQLVSALIQFPINKWVIMRKGAGESESAE